MKIQTVYIYKYHIKYGQYEQENEYKEYTSDGFVAARDYTEACAKLVEYFGDDEIVELFVKFEFDCDVVSTTELTRSMNKVDNT